MALPLTPAEIFDIDLVQLQGYLQHVDRIFDEQAQRTGYHTIRMLVDALAKSD